MNVVSTEIQKNFSGSYPKNLKVLLVYPNTWDVAIANLGFQRVHSILNRIDGIQCDILSLPNNWKPETQNLHSDDLRSREMNLEPQDFDMIAFSISFEPDYLNAVLQLKYFNIPLERDKRDNSYPLILAGGSAIFINPEPMAQIVDAFFIGEAEGLAEKFFNLFIQSDFDEPRDLLPKASKIKGMYIPHLYDGLYEKGTPQKQMSSLAHKFPLVERYWVEDELSLKTHSEMHTETSVFKDMSLLEVTRGCIWACRFCTAGFIYRPPRLPDLNKTYNSLRETLEKQGKETKTIGLVGPSVTDHPQLVSLTKRLVEEGKALSFSSLRMETLTNELVDLMKQSGQKTITVAMDAPSERMRNAVNKAATDQFIIDKCQFLAEKGILHLKLYSIIGLPNETENDIDQFIQVIGDVQKAYLEASKKHGRIGNLTIGLSPFVPKPGTPFQWHPMEKVSVLKKRFMKIRKSLSKLPNVKLSFGSPNEAYLQTYLSKGGRELINFFNSYLNSGHDEKKALNNCLPKPDEIVYRQYQQNDFLPWDIIDHGYRDNFLWNDYQRGLMETQTPACDTATCHICGIC